MENIPDYIKLTEKKIIAKLYTLYRKCEHAKLVEIGQKVVNLNPMVKNNAAFLQLLGVAYKLTGKYGMAIEYHKKHLNICISKGDVVGERSEYSNIGNAYHGLGDFNKAIEYHSKSLNICIEIGNRSGEGTTYCNLGNAYRSLGEFN
jgi:tetratricopeptide (TPR) repeat protein